MLSYVERKLKRVHRFNIRMVFKCGDNVAFIILYFQVKIKM